MTDDIGSTVIANDREKPRKKREHKGRRNYAKELHALEGRVATAVRLLRKAICPENRPEAQDELIAVSLEILEGKD